jgi:hypothetical protein
MGRSTRPPRYTFQASLLHLEVLPYPGLRGEDGSGGIDHLIHAVPRVVPRSIRGTAHLVTFRHGRAESLRLAGTPQVLCVGEAGQRFAFYCLLRRMGGGAQSSALW